MLDDPVPDYSFPLQQGGHALDLHWVPPNDSNLRVSRISMVKLKRARCQKSLKT
jgi:hypothetical protein